MSSRSEATSTIEARSTPAASNVVASVAEPWIAGRSFSTAVSIAVGSESITIVAEAGAASAVPWR